MLTKEALETYLANHELVKPRLETLRLAEKLNPKFKNPHIVGGFLRNIALRAKPNDCDVVFQGYMLNQPGVLEAVREAEKQLGITPYPEWDFENINVTGFSGDFDKDALGEFSCHTDFVTMIMMNTEGKLLIGEEKVLEQIEKRIYDLRFPGIEMWANHRGGGRSYGSCIVGDLTRGLYLCADLGLTPSPIVAYLFQNFDFLFNKLDPDDRGARKRYWEKKTKGQAKYDDFLKIYGIKTLAI